MNSMTMFPAYKRIGMGMPRRVFEETVFCNCGSVMPYVCGGSDGYASVSWVVCPNKRWWNCWFHYAIRGGTFEVCIHSREPAFCMSCVTSRNM